MKIALICPSSMVYMPYVNYYENILSLNNIDYEIINWDRLHDQDNSDYYTFKDTKIGHQRNFFDYIGFRKFIMKILKEIKFDKLVVFGIQLTYFLKDILIKNYKNKYIIDIRDYHKIINLFNIKKVIKNSSYVVISSPGYKKWLPNIGKYIINHNTPMNKIEALNKSHTPRVTSRISISYIGSLAHFDVNRDFINSLKNHENFYLIFRGQGIINDKLKKYIKENKVENVEINGRYERSEEAELYGSTDLVNMLLYDQNINNKTCMANRIYNSALYGKPMIVLEGTYLSEQVRRYNLGLVIKNFEFITDEIEEYLQNFNADQYEKGRRLFWTWVINDNKIFSQKITEFILIP